MITSRLITLLTCLLICSITPVSAWEMGGIEDNSITEYSSIVGVEDNITSSLTDNKVEGVDNLTSSELGGLYYTKKFCRPDDPPDRVIVWAAVVCTLLVVFVLFYLFSPSVVSEPFFDVFEHAPQLPILLVVPNDMPDLPSLTRAEVAHLLHPNLLDGPLQSHMGNLAAFLGMVAHGCMRGGAEVAAVVLANNPVEQLTSNIVQQFFTRFLYVAPTLLRVFHQEFSERFDLIRGHFDLINHDNRLVNWINSGVINPNLVVQMMTHMSPVIAQQIDLRRLEPTLNVMTPYSIAILLSGLVNNENTNVAAQILDYLSIERISQVLHHMAYDNAPRAGQILSNTYKNRNRQHSVHQIFSKMIEDGYGLFAAEILVQMPLNQTGHMFFIFFQQHRTDYGYSALERILLHMARQSHSLFAAQILNYLDRNTFGPRCVFRLLGDMMYDEPELIASILDCLAPAQVTRMVEPGMLLYPSTAVVILSFMRCYLSDDYAARVVANMRIDHVVQVLNSIDRQGERELVDSLLVNIFNNVNIPRRMESDRVRKWGNENLVRRLWAMGNERVAEILRSASLDWAASIFANSINIGQINPLTQIIRNHLNHDHFLISDIIEEMILRIYEEEAVDLLLNLSREERTIILRDVYRFIRATVLDRIHVKDPGYVYNG